MRRASKDARDGAAAAGDVPEMRRAVVEALQSTLVLRKAKSAVSESLSATEGAKRTRGLKQGSNGRGGGDEPLATPNVEAIRALLEDLGWAKELRHAVYALVAAAKDGPDDGEPKRRGGRRETEPLASVVSARKQWEASINDELEAIARERHQPLVREREQRGDKADGALLPPTPSGAPLRFLFDSEDPRGNATSSIERLERGRIEAVVSHVWTRRFLSKCPRRSRVAYFCSKARTCSTRSRTSSRRTGPRAARGERGANKTRRVVLKFSRPLHTHATVTRGSTTVFSTNTAPAAAASTKGASRRQISAAPLKR